MVDRDLSDVGEGVDLVMIDLDDTIFPEVDYLFAAYDEIGFDVATRCSHIQPHDVSKFLRERFIANGRDGLFQSACTVLQLPDTEIAKMLTTLRTATVPGGLKIFDDVEVLIKTLNAADRPWCILTNGHVTQQKNKIRQTVPMEVLAGAQTYFCDHYGRKPAPDALLAACADHKVLPARALMIGDSYTDELAASASGVAFLNVLEFRH